MLPADAPVQLLQAWNPLTEPLTVKVHVDALLAGGADPYVWFGRIYAGRAPGATTPEGARERWPAVAALADELDQAGRELLLLVTNFKSLHALRVDRILFGAGATRDDARHVPSYYRNETVPLWFRVRDIRPLSHDQMATLQWLDEWTRVEPEARPGRATFAFPFDPFRSFHYRYPVPLRSIPAAQVFDGAALGAAPPGRRLFAARPGAVFPPDVESSWAALRKDLDPPWSLLEESSRVFLASAALVDSLVGAGDGDGARFAMEPSAALVLLAKAVETECRAALEALRRLAPAAAPWLELPPVAAMTLGDVGAAFRALAGALPPRLPVTASLARGGEWLGWLEEFGRARNRAAHAEPLPLAEWRRHRDAIYVRSTSRLAPIASAKKELRGAARG
jgi:hypothetical protein